MKSLRNLFLSLFCLLPFIACEPEQKDPVWNDNWVDPSPKDTTEVVDPNQGQEEQKPVAKKPRYVWIDACANFEYYANDKDYIFEDMQRIKDMGFTDVIVDVRPSLGDVLFKTSYAEPLKKVDSWSGSYHWEYRTETFDYLQAFIDAGEKVGLGVNAAINTLTGGYHLPYGLGKSGPVYTDPSKKDWLTVVNSEDGLVNTMDYGDYGAKFFSPSCEEAVNYMLNIIGDLAKYDLDGIVLDRCRYDDNGMMSDFSEHARKGFEAYIGREIENFPGDIMAPGTDDIPSVITEEFKLWMEYRAKTIHDFIVKAGDKVHGVNPDIKFGAYVGGWLASYYGTGVNWASPKYNIASHYYYKKWATAKFQEYGYADHCDFIFIGAYAGADSIYGNDEWTIQGFCKQADKYLMGDVPHYGGPDIGNSSGFEKGGKGSLMPKIIDACMGASDGMFVFDLCHIRMYDYWNDFKKGFDEFDAK